MAGLRLQLVVILPEGRLCRMSRFRIVENLRKARPWNNTPRLMGVLKILEKPDEIVMLFTVDEKALVSSIWQLNL